MRQTSFVNMTNIFYYRGDLNNGTSGIQTYQLCELVNLLKASLMVSKDCFVHMTSFLVLLVQWHVHFMLPTEQFTFLNAFE